MVDLDLAAILVETIDLVAVALGNLELVDLVTCSLSWAWNFSWSCQVLLSAVVHWVAANAVLLPISSIKAMRVRMGMGSIQLSENSTEFSLVG